MEILYKCILSQIPMSGLGVFLHPVSEKTSPFAFPTDEIIFVNPMVH